jgi:regulator of CtrA degradation
MARETSLVYGTESMRLTTRLMQLASWLLLQRAANNGEMERVQLLEERKKVRMETLPEPMNGPEWPNLPKDFASLVERSLGMQKRILKLDLEIYGRATQTIADNPVDQQINLLSTALGAMRNK